KIVGVDVFQADEDSADTGCGRLANEVRNTVAQGVHLYLHNEADAFLAQRDQPVENRLPVAVPRVVVVGDDVLVDALSVVSANDFLDVISRAKARFASLDIDDGAETALIGAATTGIEAVSSSETPQSPLRQKRRYGALQVRQLVPEIIERLHLASPGVLQ